MFATESSAAGIDRGSVSFCRVEVLGVVARMGLYGMFIEGGAYFGLQ